MEKKNNIVKILIFTGIGLVALLGITFLMSKVLFKTNNSSTNNSNAFFVRNSKISKYAIYKKDGSKITDFIYKNTSNFINGYAVVTYSDNKKAIVDENGREVIKKGEYDYIFYSGGNYLLVSTNKQVSKLLNYKLNVIKENKDLSMLTINTKRFSVVTDKKKIYVYSFTGKLMYELEYKGYTTSSNIYSIESSLDEIASFYYDKKNYVFDTKQEKFVISVNTDTKYGASLTDVKNRNSYVVYGDKDYIVVNNKVVAEKEKGSIRVEKYNIFYNAKVILKKNGDLGIEFDKDSKITYNSVDSYLKEIKDTKKIEVYQDGKLITTIDGILTRSGISSGYFSDPYYVIRNKDKYLLVDKSGKILMSHDFILDVNIKDNSIKVKDGKQYYYVDLNNKELSSKSDEDNMVRLGEKYYYKKDNKLIECKTEKELDYKYYIQNSFIKGTDADIYIILRNKEATKYALFNTKTAKIVGEYTKFVSLYKDYYIVGGKYYSYINNKVFYDDNNK